VAFWVFTPHSVAVYTGVSEVHATSIFRVELLPSWRWADYGEDVFYCWQFARNEACQSLKN